MILNHWIELLKRQTPGPVTFDEIVVGHDFGLFSPPDIQTWVALQGFQGPLCSQVVELHDEGMECFEGCLWAACAEATGKTPRPGGHRWANAQDRWRVALLKDAMEAPLTTEALAVVVENIYEKVGCPEDMLALWTRPAPWQKRQPMADRAAIAAFVAQKAAPWQPFLPTAA
jgi:hypothetical protein